MHELSLSEAAIPTPAVILGLPLRVYSLGHEAELYKRRNPLLLLSHDEFNALKYHDQTNSIIEAILVCSDSWEERQKLNTPSLFGWRARWHQLKVRLWTRRIKATDYPVAIAQFRNYLESGRALPPVPDAEVIQACGYDLGQKKGRELGAPLIINLYNFLCDHPDPSIVSRRSNISEWDTAYTFAAWRYFAHHEADGNYRIQNLDEFQVREKTDRIEREVLEEQRQRAESGEPAPVATATPAPARATNGLATPPPDLTDKTEVKNA